MISAMKKALYLESFNICTVQRKVAGHHYCRCQLENDHVNTSNIVTALGNGMWVITSPDPAQAIGINNITRM